MPLLAEATRRLLVDRRSTQRAQRRRRRRRSERHTSSSEPLSDELVEVDRRLLDSLSEIAAALLVDPGVGAACAAQLLVSGGDRNRTARGTGGKPAFSGHRKAHSASHHPGGPDGRSMSSRTLSALRSPPEVSRRAA